MLGGSGIKKKGRRRRRAKYRIETTTTTISCVCVSSVEQHRSSLSLADTHTHTYIHIYIYTHTHTTVHRTGGIDPTTHTHTWWWSPPPPPPRGPTRNIRSMMESIVLECHVVQSDQSVGPTPIHGQHVRNEFRKEETVGTVFG